MSHAIKASLTHDGQEIAAQAGAVLVAVQRINSRSFRLSTRHASTGAGVR